MISTPQSVAAGSLHVDRYDRAGEWLRCRLCGARIEPSMTLVHDRSDICIVRCGLERTRKSGMVRLEDALIDTRELDRVGLIAYIMTDYDDDGVAVEQAWTRPKILELARDPVFAAVDQDRRRAILRGVSKITSRKLATMSTGELLDVR